MADYKSANIFRTDYKSMRTKTDYKSMRTLLLRPSVRYRFRYSISFRFRYRFRYLLFPNEEREMGNVK